MAALSAAEVEHFIRHGFVKLEQALAPEVIRHHVEAMWRRLGYDAADPSTWREGKIHMPGVEHFPVEAVAPRAHAAIRELCGGEDRIHPPEWSDGFIANLGWGADQTWVPPGPQASGWHKDGDFFLHFLDSPEQGLLTIVLWSDVLPQGGATFIACDSVAPVARHLAAHPEGVDPVGTSGEYGAGFPHTAFIAECRDFREATGRAGDVYLLHPFLLHASSFNHRRVARLITNPPVHLREPMRFDRERPEDHSPVERAILRGLGVERYAFRPTAERRRIVPGRIAAQARLREQELARLAAAKRA